jgi:hypothetical protein
MYILLDFSMRASQVSDDYKYKLVINEIRFKAFNVTFKEVGVLILVVTIAMVLSSTFTASFKKITRNTLLDPDLYTSFYSSLLVYFETV